MEDERKLSEGEDDEEEEDYEEEEEEDYEEEEEDYEEEYVVFITPQLDIVAKHVSRTEKEMREISEELLQLKVAAETHRDNSTSCCQAFQRFSQEVNEATEVVNELKSNFSVHQNLVRDLSCSISAELYALEKFYNETNSDLENLINLDSKNPQVILLHHLDMLIAECKTEEALSLLDSDKFSESDDSPEITKRKELLIDQLVFISTQPCVKFSELKKGLKGLINLGREALAQKLFLKVFDSRLQESIESYLPSCSVLPNTYSATLCRLFFSTILEAAKEFELLFKKEKESFPSFLVDWAESKIENFIRLVKAYAPSPESAAALCSACICVQASFTYCAILKSLGLELSCAVLDNVSNYVEDVIDENFKRAKRMVLDLSSQSDDDDDDDVLDQSWPLRLHFPADALTNVFLANNVKKFMSILKDILDQLTPMAILHFRPIILTKTHLLFDKYVDVMTEAIPIFSEYGTTIDPKEATNFKVETERQQLALLSSISIVADDLLPKAISKLLSFQGELKEPETRLEISAYVDKEYKNWEHRIKQSVNKIRVYFCRQYVFRLNYLRKGKARLDAHSYLNMNMEGDYIIGDSELLPSLPFQAFFARLQKLAKVVNEALIGRERAQKLLLAGIVEAMLKWLSNDPVFWDLIENTNLEFDEQGLQQFILDMHFVGEIAIFGGYSSRKIHQLVSAMVTRAIGAFSARGVDPQSALYEDEWFSQAAKSAIRRLVLVLSRELLRSSDQNMILPNKVLNSAGDMSSSSSDLESDSVDSASLNDAKTDYFSCNES